MLDLRLGRGVGEVAVPRIWCYVESVMEDPVVKMEAVQPGSRQRRASTTSRATEGMVGVVMVLR